MALLHKVLWTKQKTQKNKRWSDGFLRVSGYGQLTLLDENKSELDTTFSQKALEQGDTIEFDRYLAEVDELDAGGKTLNQPQQRDMSSGCAMTRVSQSAVNSLNTSSGLSLGGGPVVPRRGFGLRPRGLAPLHPRSQNIDGAPLPRQSLGPRQNVGGDVRAFYSSDFRPSCFQGVRDVPYSSERTWHHEWGPREQEDTRVPASHSSLDGFRHSRRPDDSHAQDGQHQHLGPSHSLQMDPPSRKPPRSNAAILALLGIPSQPESPSDATSGLHGPPRSSLHSSVSFSGRMGSGDVSGDPTSPLFFKQEKNTDVQRKEGPRGHGCSPQRTHTPFLSLECSNAIGSFSQHDGEDYACTQSGFLALKNVAAPQMFSPITFPSNKRPKLSPAPSLISAPRTSGGACGHDSSEIDAGSGAKAPVRHQAHGENRKKGPVSTGKMRPGGGIVFPDASAADDIDAKRSATIPDVLGSPASYKATFVAALEEEINFRLLDSAAGLYKVLREISAAGKGELVQCDCTQRKAAACATVKKEGPNTGRRFFTCRTCNFFKWADEKKESKAVATEVKVIDTSTPPNLEILRQRRQPVYACQVISTNRKDFQQINARRKAGQMDAGSKREARICLKLVEQGMGKVPGCHKDDMWIVSSSPFFTEDRFATTCIAASAWYGADGDNNIELKPLHGQLTSLMNRNVCYAFKSINAGSELDMLENLKNFAPADVPLMPALLSGGRRPTHSGSQVLPLRNTRDRGIDIGENELQEVLDEAVATHRLNEEQTQVLRDISKFILDPEASHPVILVQGVFGSGKSTLLVAVVLFLLGVFEKAKVDAGAQDGRILISAATNVAVDNILLGLLHKGYEDFIRVGCLPRIAKPILRRTLKETVGLEERIDQESLVDLNAMLAKTRDSKELAQIRAAIADCRAGKMRILKQTLNHTQVVGVTCASTRNDVLKGQKFGFCILDECSQFVEPTSFLPIARFSCRVLIGAGDPKQLPPTLSGPEGSVNSDDLGKTLFSRLANTGIAPIFLKRQYRCHPLLGTLASDLFYDSKLVNGVTEEDRRPLVKNWPALVYFDSTGSREEQHHSGSFGNVQEAQVIVTLVSQLLKNGLPGSDIGVICLYKAQETRIVESLSNIEGCSSVQVSTVDAFQGGEKEIIFVSCCRTSGLGFTASPNRMTVAITRARRHLVVVGDSNVLPQNTHWSAIMERASSLPGGRYCAREYVRMRPHLQICHPSDNEPSDDEESAEEDALSGSGKEGLQKREAGPGRQQEDSPSDPPHAAWEDTKKRKVTARSDEEERGREVQKDAGGPEDDASEEDIFAPPCRDSRPDSGVRGGQGIDGVVGGESCSEAEANFEAQDSEPSQQDEDEEALLANIMMRASGEPSEERSERQSDPGTRGHAFEESGFLVEGTFTETAGEPLAAPSGSRSIAAVHATPQCVSAEHIVSPQTVPQEQRQRELQACAFEPSGSESSRGICQLNSHLPKGSIPCGARKPKEHHFSSDRMGSAPGKDSKMADPRADKLPPWTVPKRIIPTFDLACSDSE